jgi:hypothetical protein
MAVVAAAGDAGQAFLSACTMAGVSSSWAKSDALVVTKWCTFF